MIEEGYIVKKLVFMKPNKTAIKFKFQVYKTSDGKTTEGEPVLDEEIEYDSATTWARLPEEFKKLALRVAFIDGKTWLKVPTSGALPRKDITSETLKAYLEERTTGSPSQRITFDEPSEIFGDLVFHPNHSFRFGEDSYMPVVNPDYVNLPEDMRDVLNEVNRKEKFISPLTALQSYQLDNEWSCIKHGMYMTEKDFMKDKKLDPPFDINNSKFIQTPQPENTNSEECGGSYYYVDLYPHPYKRDPKWFVKTDSLFVPEGGKQLDFGLME